MNKLIIYIVSIILVSILGFLSIRANDNQPASFYKGLKQMAGILFIDLILIFLAVYFHYN
ncbi:MULTISPECIES: hypothetical protein [Nosocomiicoccus]|uniref:hypothetical protein n=1 Tax=Nosocomiicoccus TaxID=489909 RepID=UPI0008A3F1B8|nr:MULTISPECIES: hypothetical protein [Nosocomiicoccus]MDK6864050.1 hypothetical protein [Nosocomiicoccus ampullae]OFO49643.1 hypothetical protein HMPREF3029_08905 [Nosocomiicoccus sp. HMSC059G07]